MAQVHERTEPSAKPSGRGPSPAPNLVDLGRLFTANEAIRAALDCELLEQLGGVTRTVDLVGVDPAAAELVLAALDHVGLVERVEDGWRRTLEPADLRWFRETHSSIGALLRTGGRAHDVTDADEAAPLYADVVDVLARLAEPHTDEVLAELAVRGSRVLELGSGSAVWSRGLARLHPDVALTLVDLGEVTERTHNAIIAAGLEDRTTIIAGDVFEIELAEEFDVILIAGFCRLFSAEANRRLFARAARWCRPGGTVAVIDAIDTLAARDGGLALYRLNLATRTSEGRPWTPGHYAEWLLDAGFADISIVATDAPEISLLQATRTKGPIQ